MWLFEAFELDRQGGVWYTPTTDEEFVDELTRLPRLITLQEP